MDNVIIPAWFAFRIISWLAFMMIGVFVLYMVGRILFRFAEFFDRKLAKGLDDRPRPARPTQPPSQPPDRR